MSARFGPAGNSESFYEQGYKSSIDAPKWLKTMGLDAYEYQANKGINISKDKAIELGEEAKAYDIKLSIHSPYFISLSSEDPDKRENSVRYIIDTLKLAQYMGAGRIVVHCGAASKMDRKLAHELQKETISKVIEQSKELDLNGIQICPETMGKMNQLGTVEEVVDLCKLDECLLPAIDFGHLNSRSLGGLVKYEDFLRIFEVMENELGIDRIKNFHVHYSRIEFTAGGEKKHWTYDDIEYGPEFEPIAEIVAKKNLSPTIICESRGTMAEDAVRLKEIYMGYLKNN